MPKMMKTERIPHTTRGSPEEEVFRRHGIKFTVDEEPSGYGGKGSRRRREGEEEGEEEEGEEEEDQHEMQIITTVYRRPLRGAAAAAHAFKMHKQGLDRQLREEIHSGAVRSHGPLTKADEEDFSTSEEEEELEEGRLAQASHPSELKGAAWAAHEKKLRVDKRALAKPPPSPPKKKASRRGAA